MLHRLIEASLRQRVFLLIVALVSVFIGLWSAFNLPIDAVPDITSPQVQVNTEVPALAPEETEKAVTIPLEMELAGIQGVHEMRSLTKFGLSQVTLIFSDRSDIYRARQLVAERLQAAADRLPPGLTPKLAPISTGLGEIYYYTLAYRTDATNRSPDRLEALRELREVHEFVVKPMLRTTPGIAEINANGGYEKQIVVQPRPKDLQAAGLTFADLATIVGENVENTGGGVISRGQDQLIVRTVGRVRTPEEIAELPIKFGAAVRPILVKDVADVAVGSRFRTGAATENGEEAMLGTAMMLAGENSRIVAKRFGERIREIQSRLPVGMEIRTQYDRADLVDSTVATVKKNLFEGAILVIVVLLAMLGNWRAALIVSAAIPLSFLFALTGMVRWGISGNLMSLGAVDFGLIIDGAVVLVENIVRQLGERQPEQRLDAPVDRARELATHDGPGADTTSKRDAKPDAILVLDAKKLDATAKLDQKKPDATPKLNLKNPDLKIAKLDAFKPDAKKVDQGAIQINDLGAPDLAGTFPGVFVTLAAGTFPMGSPVGEACREATGEELHAVTLTRSFEILTTEVTAAQFLLIRGYKPATATCNPCPVIDVSWHEAAAFANELSLQMKLTPCYVCSGGGTATACSPGLPYQTQIALCPGYRLPTDAEWEYAYRAGKATAYYNGPNALGGCSTCSQPLDPLLDAIGWYCANGGTAVHPVAQKTPNPWGLFDMAGNAREWINDWAGFVPSSSPLTDPNGPASGSSKILRGGSFFIYSQYARAASRANLVEPWFRNQNIGFRVVRSK